MKNNEIIKAIYYLAMVITWGTLGVLLMLFILLGKFHVMSESIIPLSLILLINILMLKITSRIENIGNARLQNNASMDEEAEEFS